MRIIFLCLLLTNASFAQPIVKKIDRNSLLKNLYNKNNIIEAVKWTDKTGDNILLLSSTLRKPNRKKDPTDDSFYDAELQAEHYLVFKDSISRTWSIKEAGTCPYDFYLYFIGKGFSVTDLNKNGNAEIWIMYKSACGNDTIPTKIIMYEAAKKYESKGECIRKDGALHAVSDDLTFDENFKNGSPAFRHYAEKMWSLHKVN